MSKSVKLLFNYFKPENYNLSLIIDKENLTFSGEVEISGMKINKPSKRLTFHQNSLKIASAQVFSLSKQGEKELKVIRINHHNKLNEVRLHFDDLAYAGKYIIKMKFNGKITKSLDGIYPSYYTDEKNQKKTIITTQFESHFARQSFPCIDEPAAKATFKLSLTSSKNNTIISNTEVDEIKTTSKNQTVSFKVTPIMSTYLLAFAIGELGFKETKTKRGLVIRSYSTPDKINQLDFSLDVAKRSLEFFEDYFKIDYPLNKLDLIALPDFSSGAMENWGLMTFREIYMLTDMKVENVDSQQQIALVICHEISHQWFGNLVTMKWWDDLWLNESFANLMEYRATNELFPAWKVWEQFISYDVMAAKKRDGLLNVQSINSKVRHPDEISTLFDPSIVYAKGGSVLYMLLNYISEDAFKQSLHNYFKKFSYRNTTANDLWDEMSLVTNLNIGKFMGNWIYKPGIPLLNINYIPNEKTISVSQERFLLDENSTDKSSETIWNIPYNTNIKLKTNLLAKKSTKLLITEKSSKSLIFNQDSRTYTLVNYLNPKHLQDICQNLDSLSQIDKFLLLDNYYLLERSNKINLLTAIKLISYYSKEDDDVIWSSIAQLISELRRLIGNNKILKDKLNILINELIDSKIKSISFEQAKNENSKQINLRSIIFALASAAENEVILKKSNQIFTKITKVTDVNPNIRNIIFNIAAKNDKNFSKLMSFYTSSNNQEEKNDLMLAVTSTKNPKNIQILLDMLKTDSIRSQDILSTFGGIFRNYYARDLAWEWYVKNFDYLKDLFSSDKSYGFFARIISNFFDKQEELNKYEDFFKPKLSEISLTREIILGISEIKNRVNWRNKNDSMITKWLKETQSF